VPQQNDKILARISQITLDNLTVATFMLTYDKANRKRIFVTHSVSMQIKIPAMLTSHIVIAISDCNPGITNFSIPDPGIEKFVIPGYRFGFRLTD